MHKCSFSNGGFSLLHGNPHLDHIGRPLLFPSTTKLIVEPGIKSKLWPGYPENKESPFRSEAFTNWEAVELSFESSPISIGNIRAIDFFGDGSFFFPHAPSHAVGHIKALARTSTVPSTIIYMGGKSFHHYAALRPNINPEALPTTLQMQDRDHRARSALWKETWCYGCRSKDQLWWRWHKKSSR